MGECIELLTLVSAQKQVGLENNDIPQPTATPFCKQSRQVYKSFSTATDPSTLSPSPHNLNLNLTFSHSQILRFVPQGCELQPSRTLEDTSLMNATARRSRGVDNACFTAPGLQSHLRASGSPPSVGIPSVGGPCIRIPSAAHQVLQLYTYFRGVRAAFLLL